MDNIPYCSKSNYNILKIFQASTNRRLVFNRPIRNPLCCFNCNFWLEQKHLNLSLFHLKKIQCYFNPAVVCHHNTFYLYESLLNAEIKKWRQVTHTSVGIALLLMATLGIAGYSTFTSTVQGISGHKIKYFENGNLISYFR